MEVRKILVGMVYLVLVVAIVTPFLLWWTEGWWWTFALWGLPLYWFFSCVVILRPGEMAVRTSFGKAKEVLKEGAYFYLRPEATLARYPRKQYNFDFGKIKVTTAQGWWPLDSSGNKTDDSKYYSQATVEIDSALYFSWPEDDKLMDAFRYGPNPWDEPGMKDWMEEEVFGAIRVAVGKMTWGEVRIARDKIVNSCQTRFSESGRPFEKIGAKVKLVIKEVILPKDLEDAIILPQQAEMKKLAKRAEIDAFTEAMSEAKTEQEENAITMKQITDMMAGSKGEKGGSPLDAYIMLLIKDEIAKKKKPP